MIKISRKGTGKHSKPRLRIDGKIFKVSVKGEAGSYRVVTGTPRVAQALLNRDMTDFDKSVAAVSLRTSALESLQPLPAWLTKLTLVLAGTKRDLDVVLSLSETSWVSPPPIGQYFRQLVDQLRESRYSPTVESEVVNAKPSTSSSAQYVIHATYSGLTAGSLAEFALPRLSEIRDAQESALAHRGKADRRQELVEHFEFPPAVRSSCEQYLLHFVDFLRALGVEATAEIREDADRVLFSVTPKDRHHALENIRKALNLYLHLPEAELTLGPLVDPGDAFVVQKLVANVYHLRGQIDLVRAQLALKDATILAHQAHISMQHVELDLLRYRALPPQSDPSPKPDAEEERVARYVSVKPLEIKGLKVDIPKFMRDVKALLRK